MKLKKSSLRILYLFFLIAFCLFNNSKANASSLVISKYYTDETIVADYIISPNSNSATDMSTTIQTALNNCSNAGGGTVFLKSGIYRLSKSINVPMGCTLRGEYQDPDDYDGTLQYGTIIEVDVNNIDYGTRSGLINLNPNSGIIGVTFYYLNQTLNNLKSQPFTIHYDTSMMYYIKDITFLNSYRGIGRSLEDQNAHEMLMIENVKGTVFYEGVIVHNSSDVGTITDLTLSPSYLTNANYSALGVSNPNYTQQSIANKIKSIQGKGLIITDAEQQQYLNVTLSGYYYGVYIPDDSVVQTRAMGSGSFYNLNISDCTRGFMVESGIGTCRSGASCTMIDNRIGYLISNSSISGSEYSIYNGSSTLNGLVGTIKLNDVSISGNTYGRILYYSSERQRYLTASTNTTTTNTNQFSKISTKKEKKNAAKSFIALEAGSSVDQINEALTNIGNQGGGVVYLKPGLYTINSLINVPANVELRGAFGSPIRFAGRGASKPLGTVINTTQSGALINLKGNNAGLSGIFITYSNNIASLNENGTFTTNSYTIVSENTSNIYIKNVTMAASYNGILFNNVKNFVVANVITGNINNSFRFDNSSNGTLMNCLQNGTVVSRNSLYAFSESANLFNNFFTNTKDNLQYIYLNNSQHIEIFNCFIYSGRIFLSSYGSDSYLVNTGIDGFSTNGLDFFFSNDSKSTITSINSIRLDRSLYSSENAQSEIGLYNNAVFTGSSGTISENDVRKENNKLTWDDTSPTLRVSYTNVSAQKVQVTIQSNEQVQAVSGWTLSSDKKTLTKDYTANTYGFVSVKDSNNNKKSAHIFVTSVSATCPTLADYSGNYDGNDHSITVSGGSGGTIQYSTDQTNWSTTKPTRTNAGTTTVYVKVVGDAYHNDKICGSKVIQINKIAATLTCANKTYNGSEQTACTCSGGTIGGEYKATNYRASSYVASCSPDGNHTAPANQSWNMQKKDLTITAKDQTINYGDSISSSTSMVSASGLVSGDSITEITLTPSTSSPTSNGTITPSNAKSSKGIDNYSVSYTNGKLVINKVSATCPTITDYSGNYDGQAHSITVAGGSGGTIQYSTNNSSWSTTNPTRKEAGTTTVYVKVVGDSNHSDTTCGSKTIQINKIAATLTCANKTYNGSEQTACTCSGGTIGGEYKATNYRASSYVASCSPDGNHTAPSNQSWNMQKKALTITAKDQTINYGDSISSSTSMITASGLVSGDSITEITLTPSTANATSNGTITPSNVQTSKGSSNYQVSYVSGILVINQTLSTCPTLADYSGNYDGQAHSITVSGGSGGTIQYSTDQTNWSTTKPTRTNAGTTTVYVKVVGDAYHNDKICGSKVIQINKIAATLTCANKTYNGSEQTACTCSGGTIGGEYKATNYRASSYVASCSPDGNHTAPANQSWNMQKKTLTITAKDQTINYGDSISSSTSMVSASGLVSGDSIIEITLKPSTTNVTSNGTITPSNAKSSKGIDNYSVSYTNGKLVINKVSATCPTLADYSGNYDGQAHSITVSGGSGGTIQYSTDQSNWSTTKPTRTNAGTTTVYVKVVGDAYHNDKICGSKVIQINKIAATLTCANKTYNGSEQTACTCSGGTIGGEYKATNYRASSYVASCSPDGNHTAPANQSWNMQKKALTITAKDQTINYGDSISSSTSMITASGLVSGDSITEITLTPSTANVTSNGTITPSNAKSSKGIDNYSVSYTNGKLVINTVSATCPTLADYSGNYDGQAHSITVTGGSGGTIQYSTDQSNWSTTKPTRMNIGTTIVYVKVVGDANHNDKICGSKIIQITSAPSIEEPKVLNYPVENQMIFGIKNSTDVSNANIEFNTPYTYKIFNNARQNKTSGFVSTGDIVEAYLENVKKKEFRIVIKGDVNGDGMINSADLLKIRQHLLKTITLDNPYSSAADTTSDSTINSADLLRVRQHLLNIKTIEG